MVYWIWDGNWKYGKDLENEISIQFGMEMGSGDNDISIEFGMENMN